MSVLVVTLGVCGIMCIAFLLRTRYRLGIKRGIEKVTADLYYKKIIDIETANNYCVRSLLTVA